ncbi:hypothetical protein ABT025_09525 [Streptomyces sp. NPDC002809]|uniref:hypothetical protein n=1 Tax=Streptomyces sp. NPDC002809 TaxID=3154433 RepID=UPI0033234DB6
MFRKRSVIGTAAVAMTAVGTLLAAAPAAQAAPDNCTISSASTVTSLCTGGTGHHRIHAVLRALDPRLPQRIVLGDWALPGQTSVATNPWGPGYVVSIWVDTVDW